ncbi:ABC transporter ATP-binding protein [Desulfotignum balticum]|jgi:putative ABC transport system ATP-binding protein|uniref:ABC transporter ATP-binding protein n=1 Tax=Desulfotignum balticum TaxID=115781 RepID=A0A931CVK7_9BACT|nr:ABC transporter ATP-binding protein [Desulfotignum balticum]MBG0780172.1 ABC transporter ATP-binding protein [Desulfotignum balticum]
MNIVTFETVSKTYRTGETTVTALGDVSLKIPKGMFTAFVGPSGSGKTTALNLIGCLDQPSKGTVTVAGQATGNMNRRQSAAFRGKHLGFVFQDFNLLPVLTVHENVEYPLLMIQDLPKSHRGPAVEKVLAAVGMADQAGKYPAQLSGGQKQRVAIARALVGNPALVLADEPTANLDGATAQKVIDLMKRMRDEFGITFIFSTHDPRIMDQAEAFFHMEDGRLKDASENMVDPLGGDI